MIYPDRIDVGHDLQAWVARWAGRKGRTVIVFRAGTDEEITRFQSHGERAIGIENAKECARVWAENAPPTQGAHGRQASEPGLTMMDGDAR